MLDNFDHIAKHLHFDSDDDFYFVQLIQRRKENPDMKVGSRAVKTYQIRSLERLMEYKPDIITFCNELNARATIRVNKRSKKRCAVEALRELARCIADEDYIPLDKVANKILGKYSAEDKKKWVLDVDDILADDPKVQEIINFVNGIHPATDRVITVIPSKTGCHVISTGFNPKVFKAEYPEIEIMDDSPTNLYIP